MTQDIIEQPPTRLGQARFLIRAHMLQLRRAGQDLQHGARRYPQRDLKAFPVVLAETRSPLFSHSSGPERGLELGKTQNLRLAARRIHGTSLPAGAIFSFWKQIGRASRGRGYTVGRQLREGCLYPAIGGGLCQLSNALYEVALQAGCEIVERHAHSHVIPGSAAAEGRDATVSWNYIDLRFKPVVSILIEVRLTSDELIVRLRSTSSVEGRPRPSPVHTLSLTTARPVLDPLRHSCATCNEAECFRHHPVDRHNCEPDTSAAFLLDELWPEFQAYVSSKHTAQDTLAIPVDGNRWNRPRYAWNSEGFARVYTATLQTLFRSYNSRRLGKYGARRIEAQLQAAEQLARQYARALDWKTETVYVSQSILPFLWRDGRVGGRRFEVLMTRMPLSVLHTRLDRAAKIYPQSNTLTEFRAPEWLADAEADALEAADCIVTPHSGIAGLFPNSAVKLDWISPTPSTVKPGEWILFPGPTAARKGAFALREVILTGQLKLRVMGADLEGDGFWNGVTVERGAWETAGAWLNGARCVVLPALVEDAPRSLLMAVANGVPVIASPECGLRGMAGVTEVPFGDTTALSNAILSLAG